MSAPGPDRDGRLADELAAAAAAIARISEQEGFFREHDKQEEFSHLTQHCCLQTACSIHSCLQIIFSGLLPTDGEIKLARVKEALEEANPHWARAYAQHEGRDAVDSIRDNRNRIAHCQASDITIGRLGEWWESSRMLLLDLQELAAGGCQTSDRGLP